MFTNALHGFFDAGNAAVQPSSSNPSRSGYQPLVADDGEPPYSATTADGSICPSAQIQSVAQETEGLLGNSNTPPSCTTVIPAASSPARVNIHIARQQQQQQQQQQQHTPSCSALRPRGAPITTQQQQQWWSVPSSHLAQAL
jgi:hypothetical protein